MTEQEGRLDSDSFDKLPISDVPYLKKVVQVYRDNPEFTKEEFFSFALLGFYDATWGGLDDKAGHIIYRLSDAVEKSERETMAIYPGEKGSTIIDGLSWDSLENWRREWEHLHPVIPEYTKQLPKGLSLEKPKNTP